LANLNIAGMFYARIFDQLIGHSSKFIVTFFVADVIFANGSGIV